MGGPIATGIVDSGRIAELESTYFTAQRLFCMRVEKFFYRLSSKNRRIPMGRDWIFDLVRFHSGICKDSGMIDEIYGFESNVAEPQPWEFRSKPCMAAYCRDAGAGLLSCDYRIIIFVSWFTRTAKLYFSFLSRIKLSKTGK